MILAKKSTQSTQVPQTKGLKKPKYTWNLPWWFDTPIKSAPLVTSPFQRP